MKNLGVLLKSKRFWLAVATVSASSTGLVPPHVAEKIIAVGVVVTKVIDMGVFDIGPTANGE